MLARQAVLLTPLKSALPDCLPFYKQIAAITPLESALTGPSQLIENIATLTPAESALTDIPSVTSLDSALTKNRGVPPSNQKSIPESSENGTLVHPDHRRGAAAHSCQPPVTGYQSLSYSFSYSYELFCNHQNPKLFLFLQFQTPSQKHLGLGCTPSLLTSRSPLFSTTCPLFCNFLLFFAPFSNLAPLFSIVCALFCTFWGRGEGPPLVSPREFLSNCLAPSGKSFSASPL